MHDPIAQFIEWYKQRPIIAKSFLTISFFLAAIISFTSLNVYDIFYSYQFGLANGQIWRPLTSLFFLGGLDLGFICAAYLAYQILYYTQHTVFGKQHLADYIMLLIFDFFLIISIATLYDMYFVADAFIFALLYVQSQIKPFIEVQLVFGIKIPVKYYIWIYAGFNVILGQSFVRIACGFLIGYLYVKIKSTFKNKLGYDLWPTPEIIKKIVQKYVEWSSRVNRQIIEEQDQQIYD